MRGDSSRRAGEGPGRTARQPSAEPGDPAAIASTFRYPATRWVPNKGFIPSSHPRAGGHVEHLDERFAALRRDPRSNHV